jgi:DNA-binding LytR/AlgR family response regulator
VKFKLVIDTKKEEEIIVYAHKKTTLTDEIEALVNNYSKSLVGYKDAEIVKFNLGDTECFFIENSKVYAYLNKEKLQIKFRLYEIENYLNESFVRINQSCIVNIKYIKKFKSSFNGALMVEMKNGYQDYVSRRELKKVKERLGL